LSVLPVGFGSAVAGGYQIERSLRFNSADTAYLNRTPGSAPSNADIGTWSFWVKRTKLATEEYIFGSRDGGNVTLTGIRFTSGDALEFTMFSGGTALARRITTQLFRDVGAWYHFVVVYDSTLATAGDRVKIYVNGVQITAFSTTTNPSQNQDLIRWAANGIPNYIGNEGTTLGNYGDYYLTEVNYLDGQFPTTTTRTVNGITETILTQLGEFNSSTGVWVPKAWGGTYGTNGFYLPFKTASNWSGFFDGTDDKLTSSTNAIPATGEFSVEAWVYQTARTITSDQHIFSQYTSGATAGRWYLRFNGTTVAFTTGLGTSVSCATTVNTGTWYHVCVTRDSGNRFRVFLNGVLDGTAVISGSLDTAASVIGATQTANYWQGYISNVRAVSGQIPTAYQTSSTTVGASIFTPSTSQLTAVSGTSLLTCQSSTFVDNSGLGRTITPAGDARPQQFSPFTLDVTDDHSGQGNHWIPNNLDLRTTGAGADIMVDTPTPYGTDTGVGGEVRGNYCTLNPLKVNLTLSNGSLDASIAASSSANQQVMGTFGVSSGKWYFEIRLNTVGGSGTGTTVIGVTKLNSVTTTNNISNGQSWSYYGFNGQKYNTTGTAYGNTYAAGDTVGVALDMDNGKIWFSKNGVFQASGDPVAGTNAAFTNLTGETVTPWVQDDNANSPKTFTANFGQRAFAYTAPSGFKALCTQNLTYTHTIGATSTTQANDYFNAVTWTGDGNNPRTVSGVGFQPDLVWSKLRSGTASHNLYDAVRGTGKVLYSDLTEAEATNNAFGYLSAFNSDGFVATAGSTSNAYFNTLNSTYVAWNWNAGGSNQTISVGQYSTSPNVPSIASTVRANTTSRFSIVTYTGNGTNGATVGHGLGTTPAFVIIKSRSLTGSSPSSSWICWHKSISQAIQTNNTIVLTGYTGAIYLNLTAQSGTYSFDAQINGNTQTYVAYCFAEVPGYSAFGSYTGNGSNTDGPFVYTGFRPRWIMIKSIGESGGWTIMDTNRLGYNPNNSTLYAEAATAEQGYLPADILSNGFKIRLLTTGTSFNTSNIGYIYAAFAESPFKYSLAR
jgi:hypothetical protein